MKAWGKAGGTLCLLVVMAGVIVVFTPAIKGAAQDECGKCFDECLPICEKYPPPTEEDKPTEEPPSKEDGPTPCAYQFREQKVGPTTPTPTPYPTCEAYYWEDDPWIEDKPIFNLYTLPHWKCDVNNDGNCNGTDSYLVALAVNYPLVNTDWTSTPTPTWTPTSTYTPLPTWTPPPTCGPGGDCSVTEAQGAEFVNGINTAVLLLAIGIPCLVGLFVAGMLVFFNRRG